MTDEGCYVSGSLNLPSANRLEVVQCYPGRWASDGIQGQDLVIAVKGRAAD